MKLWRCSVCGYLHEGEAPPEKCPKCGAPKEKFAEVTTEAVELIDRSRYSNDLHMELYGLLENIEAVGEDGVEDNLDPGCNAIFSQAMEFAKVNRQKIKAELQAHMNKGKWG